MKKFFIFLLALVAILAGGFFVVQGCSGKGESASQGPTSGSEQRLESLARVSQGLADEKGRYPAPKDLASTLTKNLGAKAVVGNPDDISADMKANAGLLVVFVSEGNVMEVGLVDKGATTGYYLKVEGFEHSIEEVEVG